MNVKNIRAKSEFSTLAKFNKIHWTLQQIILKLVVVFYYIADTMLLKIIKVLSFLGHTIKLKSLIFIISNHVTIHHAGAFVVKRVHGLWNVFDCLNTLET